MKNQISRNLVISLFGNRHELTVDEAAECLSIPASTMSGIFYRLEKKGIIVKNSTKKIGKGRPVHCYRVKLPRAVAACKFDGTEIVGAIFSEELEILASEQIAIKEIANEELAGDILRELLVKLLRASELSYDSLGGVGISINAVQMGDRIFMSSVLPWADSSVSERFSQKLGTEVKLTISPVVLAEYQKIEGKKPNTLVRFIVGDGVSAHSIVNGQLLKGASSLGGELGHVIIDDNGPLCGCGRRGCLEAYCSGLAIRNDIVRNLDSGANSILSYEILAFGNPREAMNHVWEMWKQGDTFLRTYMNRIFGWLGWGLGLIVNILDPDSVCFGGYVLRNRPEWIQEIISKSEQWILHSARRNIAFESSRVTIEDELRVIATGFYY